MATDTLFHHLSTQYPGSVLKFLQVKDHADYRASSLTLKDIERRMDIIFENYQGPEKVIYVEYQCYFDELIFRKSAAKMLHFSIEKRYRGELRSVVIFEKQAYYRGAWDANFHYENEQNFVYKPQVIILQDLSLEELENLEDIHLVPLFPLCGIPATMIKEKTPAWTERVKKEASSESELVDILTLLGGFTAHRLGNVRLETINELLGGFKMEETQVGKDLINIGILKGIEKGEKRGEIRGKIRGRREEAFHIILMLLEKRFGKVPVDLFLKIQKINDLDKLHEFTKSLIDIQDIGELKKMLN